MLLAFLAALLSAIVLTLDRQAAHANARQAASVLVAGARLAASDVRGLNADLRTRAGMLAASPNLQRAALGGDRAELDGIARRWRATIRTEAISVGVLPSRPRLVATATLHSGSGAIARVTLGLPLDGAAVAQIRRETPLPAPAELLLVRAGRVIAGRHLGARVVVRRGLLTLGRTSLVGGSARLPVEGVSLIAVEPLSATSAGVRIFRRRTLIAALLTLLIAAALAVPLARPLTRRFGELSDRAERDALTGLANRRALDERLEEELDRARRYRTHLSLVLVDIDDFKQVNDRYGHQSGDDLLRAFATALSGSLRELDLAARFGGEEFALLLPGTPSGGACIVAEQIRRLVSELELVGPGGLPIRLTASFGVADYPSCATVDELYECADRRLYDAKRRGKDQVVGVELAEAVAGTR
jgi:diguanylate cyclase (GGDEF)-like protein